MAKKLTNENYKEYARQVMELPASHEVADTLYKLGMYAKQTDNDILFARECWSKGKQKLNEHIKSKGFKDWIQLDVYASKTGQSILELDEYYAFLKEEAFYDFESFVYYMEKNRDATKRFYAPRRRTLKVVADDLTEFDESKTMKFYGLSLPSRTGKSTLCILFLAWVAMKRPNTHSAMGGHSGILAKGFYKELLNLMLTPEYTYQELFKYFHPEYKDEKFPTSQSAEDFTITLGDPDRFATITCRGIDGTWTGAIDVSDGGYLYVDDLVRDREHSLSPVRMENTYQEYLNKMVDRKSGADVLGGAKELMVGTLWSVLDPLERVRVQFEGDERYRFRRIPALNEEDESNFKYSINGFSTNYYREMRERLDNAEWMAKYQQEPFVREGLLFPKEELRYFNGILPDGDSRVVAVVDVAFGGGDRLSMPIGREYENGDVYIFDWVFNAGAKEITVPLVVGKIMSNEIRQCRFEGNVGGAMYSDYVDDELRRQGYKCSCTEKKAPNKMSKEEKIIAYSGDIKRRFVFLQEGKPSPKQREEDDKNGITRYYRSDEYQKAMDEVCMHVSVGKNLHDDAVDGLTQLEMFLEGDGVSHTVIRHGVL